MDRKKKDEREVKNQNNDGDDDIKKTKKTKQTQQWRRLIAGDIEDVCDSSARTDFVNRKIIMDSSVWGMENEQVTLNIDVVYTDV